MVLFILFHGSGDNKHTWDDFQIQLKKIGHVYTYTAKYNNLVKYMSTVPNNIKKLYDDDINFDLDYLDVEEHCKRIYYDATNKYPNEKIIIIAHSFGNLFAQVFSKMFKKQCLFMIIIDGMLLGKFWLEFNKKFYEKITLTNNKLKMLQNKILKETNKNKLNKYANELYEISYNILQNYNASHDFSKLPVKTIYFRNYNLNSLDKDENMLDFIIEQNKEINNYHKNNANFECIYFINKSHYLHHDKEIIKIIIDKIKQLLN